jgi:hypothetical protein
MWAKGGHVQHPLGPLMEWSESYTANHSILWAIIHGILGWLYVIYFALFRS